MASQEDAGKMPLFHVNQQMETTRIDAAGHVQRVMQIGFTAPDGIAGSVYVPIANYSVTTARDAIIARLSVLQAVANLTA